MRQRWLDRMLVDVNVDVTLNNVDVHNVTLIIDVHNVTLINSVSTGSLNCRFSDLSTRPLLAPLCLLELLSQDSSLSGLSNTLLRTPLSELPSLLRETRLNFKLKSHMCKPNPLRFSNLRIEHCRV